MPILQFYKEVDGLLKLDLLGGSFHTLNYYLVLVFDNIQSLLEIMRRYIMNSDDRVLFLLTIYLTPVSYAQTILVLVLILLPVRRFLCEKGPT